MQFRIQYKYNGYGSKGSLEKLCGIDSDQTWKNVFLKKDKDKGLCAGEEFKGVFVCIFIMCQSRQIQSALITATKQPEASLASSVKYVRFFLI